MGLIHKRSLTRASLAAIFGGHSQSIWDKVLRSVSTLSDERIGMILDGSFHQETFEEALELTTFDAVCHVGMGEEGGAFVLPMLEGNQFDVVMQKVERDSYVDFGHPGYGNRGVVDPSIWGSC